MSIGSEKTTLAQPPEQGFSSALLNKLFPFADKLIFFGAAAAVVSNNLDKVVTRRNFLKTMAALGGALIGAGANRRIASAQSQKEQQPLAVNKNNNQIKETSVQGVKADLNEVVVNSKDKLTLALERVSKRDGEAQIANSIKALHPGFDTSHFTVWRPSALVGQYNDKGDIAFAGMVVMSGKNRGAVINNSLRHLWKGDSHLELDPLKKEANGVMGRTSLTRDKDGIRGKISFPEEDKETFVHELWHYVLRSSVQYLSPERWVDFMKLSMDTVSNKQYGCTFPRDFSIIPWPDLNTVSGQTVEAWLMGSDGLTGMKFASVPDRILDFGSAIVPLKSVEQVFECIGKRGELWTEMVRNEFKNTSGLSILANKKYVEIIMRTNKLSTDFYGKPETYAHLLHRVVDIAFMKIILDGDPTKNEAVKRLLGEKDYNRFKQEVFNSVGRMYDEFLAEAFRTANHSPEKTPYEPLRKFVMDNFG